MNLTAQVSDAPHTIANFDSSIQSAETVLWLIFWVNVLTQTNPSQCWCRQKWWLTESLPSSSLPVSQYITTCQHIADLFGMHELRNTCLNDLWHTGIRLLHDVRFNNKQQFCYWKLRTLVCAPHVPSGLAHKTKITWSQTA